MQVIRYLVIMIVTFRNFSFFSLGLILSQMYFDYPDGPILLTELFRMSCGSTNKI
jgi:hypothetical protein